MKDISCFNREVYEQVTSAIQSYSVDQGIECGGNTCVLVIRRLRGGTGDKFAHASGVVGGRPEPSAKAKSRCEFLLEVDRTSIRLVQAQRPETIQADRQPCSSSHMSTPLDNI